MTTTTKQTTNLVQIRGESGRCYGYFNPQTGVIYVNKGQVRDRIDMSAYLTAARQEGRDVAVPHGEINRQSD